jgi:hypothetical protein
MSFRGWVDYSTFNRQAQITIPTKQNSCISTKRRKRKEVSDYKQLKDNAK